MLVGRKFWGLTHHVTRISPLGIQQKRVEAAFGTVPARHQRLEFMNMKDSSKFDARNSRACPHCIFVVPLSTTLYMHTELRTDQRFSQAPDLHMLADWKTPVPRDLTPTPDSPLFLHHSYHPAPKTHSLTSKDLHSTKGWSCQNTKKNFFHRIKKRNVQSCCGVYGTRRC